MADEPRLRLGLDPEMSLLVPQVLLGPKVPSATRVLRISKARRLAHPVTVTSLPTWAAGAALEVLDPALPLAPVPSVACRTRLPVGFRLGRNSRRWVMVHGTPISSRRAPVAPLVLQ